MTDRTLSLTSGLVANFIASRAAVLQHKQATPQVWPGLSHAALSAADSCSCVGCS